MSKVLVTGAGGFIGSHVCETLIGDNYEVIGLIHKNKEKVAHLESDKNFKVVKCDLTDFKSILNILKTEEMEGIFHTAALHSPKEIDSPFPYFDSNTLGTLNLLEACRVSDVKKIIYSSSMSVYGNKIEYLPVDEKHPLNLSTFYSLTKYQGEEFCKLYVNNYGFEICILRYAGVYGPRRDWGAITAFVRNAMENKPIKILSDLEWDIIYVKDIARANILAFENLDKINFDVINIGSGKKVNIKDVATLIIDIAKSKSNIEIGENLSSFQFYYNIERAKKLLGFQPRQLREGLTEYIKDEEQSLRGEER